MTTTARWGARLVGAAMLAATAGIHADLYANLGYQHIPRIGPMFLALIIGASALCLAVLLTPSRYAGLVALAGAVTELLTAVGLVILTHRSLPGLNGFMESSQAPHYTSALVTEIIGFVALGAYTAMSLRALRRRNPSP